MTVLAFCAAYCQAAGDPIEYPPAGEWVGMNAQDHFGESASAYGDEIVIGTSNSSTYNINGQTFGRGYVSVYKRTANGDFPDNPSWTYGNLYDNRSIAILHMGNKGFGNSVSMSANHIAVGAVNNNQAFAFRRDETGSWPSKTTFMQLLRQNVGDKFGGIKDGPNANPDYGKLVISVNNDGTTQVSQDALDAMNDHYGCYVSVSGDTIAISACNYNANIGAVYLYTTKKAAGLELVFNEQPYAVVTLSAASEARNFGRSTALTPNYLAVGAPFAPSNDHSGEVLIFGRTDDTNDWMTTPLSINGAPMLKGLRPHGRFGWSMSMTAKSLVVGDYQEFQCSTEDATNTKDCSTTATDFAGEVSIWNYAKKDQNSIDLSGNVVIAGSREKQSFGLAVSLGEEGTRIAVGGNDDSCWVYGTDANGMWSSDLIATQVGDGGGYGNAVVAGKDYILVAAYDRYGESIQSVDNGRVYIYRIFEASPLSITIIFGITVLSITLVCFIGLYLRFYFSEEGDAKVIDPKLAAKAARLGFDHHNVGHKHVARRKGEAEKEKKYLAPQGKNVLKMDISPKPSETNLLNSSNPMNSGKLMVKEKDLDL